MAMIQCPECGQEISDKAKKCIHCGKVLIEEIKTKKCSECGTENSLEAAECIHCGCPFEKIAIQQEKETNNQPKKDMKKIIIPVVAVIIVAIIGMVIYNVKVVKPKKIEAQNKATYEEAISLLEKGKYGEANELFSTIEGYSDVEIIQEQLKYESYAYSAINDLKKYLKNPDSFQPYEITFYASEGTESDNADSDENIGEEEYPVCIMHYGAQNGFGGTTTAYAIFCYDAEDGEYEVLGSCNSLDEEDYDTDDEEDLWDLIICELVKSYRDGNDTVGDIDLARLKNVLKNDAYSAIKIIE